MKKATYDIFVNMVRRETFFYGEDASYQQDNQWHPLDFSGGIPLESYTGSGKHICSYFFETLFVEPYKQDENTCYDQVISWEHPKTKTLWQQIIVNYNVLTSAKHLWS